jgi:hypothetical protein
MPLPLRPQSGLRDNDTAFQTVPPATNRRHHPQDDRQGTETMTPPSRRCLCLERHYLYTSPQLPTCPNGSSENITGGRGRRGSAEVWMRGLGELFTALTSKQLTCFADVAATTSRTTPLPQEQQCHVQHDSPDLKTTDAGLRWQIWLKDRGPDLKTTPLAWSQGLQLQGVVSILRTTLPPQEWQRGLKYNHSNLNIAAPT